MTSLSRRCFVSTCAAFALPVPLRAQPTAPAFDLVIRGGIVSDPARGLQARADLGIRGGRIAAIDDLAGAAATRTFDAAGRWVMPGLVDLQVRCGYTRKTSAALASDAYARASGVTTWASAGEIEADDVAAFRQDSRQRNRTRTYAFVNFDRRTAARDRDKLRMVERMLAEQHDVVLGLMLRLDGIPANDLRPLLDAAIDVIRHAGTRTRILCPLPASTDSGSLLAGLRPGDIVTGVYGSTALIQEGRVNAAVVDARKRGVIIDVGHGLSRFDVHTARIALEQGLLPDVISSASQAVSPAGLPHPPLIDVMSTFLDLGLDVDQVQAMTTTHPARIIGRDAHLGTLALGAIANIAVVGIERRTGSAARIEVVATLRGGLWLHAGP